jgi:hypothetical protein
MREGNKFKVGDIVKPLDNEELEGFGVVRGEEYEVIRATEDGIVNLKNIKVDWGFYDWRFELVKSIDQNNKPDIYALIEKAKSMVGKRIDGKFASNILCTGWRIADVNSDETLSKVVLDYLQINDFCVYVHDGKPGGFKSPVENCELVKDTEEVKLNNTYTATVHYDGTIKVGCQKFNISKVEEILKAYKNLHIGNAVILHKKF